jgi:hypothetical protein
VSSEEEGVTHGGCLQLSTGGPAAESDSGELGIPAHPLDACLPGMSPVWCKAAMDVWAGPRAYRVRSVRASERS